MASIDVDGILKKLTPFEKVELLAGEIQAAHDYQTIY